MEQVKAGVAWLKSRVSERTSWDGFVICAVCLLVICTGAVAELVAWVGLAYGIWTCYKAE
jgi:hypothetical protein